jgi:molybdopterin-guanine dinucleotide biosynthesis protein
MKMVMVGGHTRNIGKTSVVESIIAATPWLNWTAVKVTQFGHGICSMDSEPCGCAVAEHQFSISEERHDETGTDTARFLAAGARRSLWVRTRQGELFAALPEFRNKIENDEFIIVESNSMRRFINPDIYLQVLDPSNPDFKQSAQQFFDLSDAFVLVNGVAPLPGTPNIELLIREIRRNKPCFRVEKQDRFISPDVIDFVISKLELGERRLGSDLVSGQKTMPANPKL